MVKRNDNQSLAVQFAALPEADRKAFVASLSEDEANALLYDWKFWARPAQLPPDWSWYCWLILAGRGFGKTRSGAEFIIARAYSGQYRNIALIGETAADVRDVMIEVGESSIIKISPPWFQPHYEPSKRRLTWPNGAVAIAYSGDDPDQLRGPQHDTAWADEPAKWRYADETWMNLEMGLRLGPLPQVVATTTPRPTALIKSLINDSSVAVTSGSTYDNYANLSGAFIERVVKRYEGTRLGRQELHAEVLLDVQGALWTQQQIDDLRVRHAPVLNRIVVAIDPSASDTESSDEAGIIVAGTDANGHGYVLDDISVRGLPLTWAKAACEAYHEWQADRIVAESNNGGDMVTLTLQTADPTVATRKLWASRGKYTRAEPVSALYEQGRIHHVGLFSKLEDELCNWVPTSGKSPNRLDALVWAFTELMIDPDVGYVPSFGSGQSRQGLTKGK